MILVDASLNSGPLLSFVPHDINTVPLLLLLLRLRYPFAASFWLQSSFYSAGARYFYGRTLLLDLWHMCVIIKQASDRCLISFRDTLNVTMMLLCVCPAAWKNLHCPAVVQVRALRERIRKV